MTTMKKHYSIISLIVEDEPGVLARIATLFSRKGYNLETVNVGKIPGKNLSSMIFTVYASENTLEQIIKQTEKLVRTISVTVHSDEESVVREHCLIRLESNGKSILEIKSIAKKFNAKILFEGEDNIILELVDSPQKINEFVTSFGKAKVNELRRSGINAVTKNGVDD